MSITRIALITLLLLAFNVRAHAQDTLLTLFGKVKDYTNGMPLSNAMILFQDQNDPKNRIEAKVDGSGRYTVHLHTAYNYLISYSAKGHYPKRIVIEMLGLSDQEWEGGYAMEVDIVLLAVKKGLDGAIFNEPFGRAIFDHGSQNFEWDMAFTAKRREQQAEFLERYKK